MTERDPRTNTTDGTVKRGLIAGALAATAIVLFFLIVDTLRGEPLQTPAFMAGVLLGLDEPDRGAGLLAAYTAFHYASFIVLGIGVAWLLDRAGTPAPLLLGLVVGFLLFDLVFYASVMISGVDVLEALGWPTFLAGNLIGGLVLVGYLGMTGPTPARSWRELFREHTTIRQGLVAGVIGAVALAVWFFIMDALAGRLLFTPAALGSALFYGAATPAAVQVDVMTVVGYSVLHVGAFMLLGLLFAALVTQADENPPLLMGLILLFVTFQTLVIGLIAIVAAWLLDVIPWWSIALGNLVAAGVMGVYLWRQHPGLGAGMDPGRDPGAEPGVEPGAGRGADRGADRRADRGGGGP